jgi:ribosome-associated protein
MQYIGRLMRDIDPAPVAAYIERLRTDRSRSNREQHDVERWRARLVAEDGALTELAALAPELDLQQVRALIRNARNEQARDQPPKAQRALFRLLRELLSGDDVSAGKPESAP